MDEIAKLVQAAAEGALAYALVLAAVGTVAMAIVEFVKATTRWRMRFHRYAIARWLRHDSLAPEERSRLARFKSFLVEELEIWRGVSALPECRHDLKREILGLTAGGERDAEAWYDQAADVMFAQLQSAAQIALDFPERYPKAYAFLTEDGPTEGDREDAESWPGRAPGFAAGAGVTEGPPAGAGVEEALAVRTRLGNLVARRVEVLESWSGWRSARSNQFLAFAAGAALFAGVELWVKAPAPQALILGVVAGMVAPFAKDLVDRLTGVRTKR
jgi:hypothetical protein